MLQDERAPFVAALERARVAAYDTGEFVGQESFMRASEILALAYRAGVGPATRVLDLCCGVAGPGRLITRELGCSYVGIDYSDSAIAIARERAAGLDCRFEVGAVPPLPQGEFDVVLLLETILAFPDKGPLLDAIVSRLCAGGRFAFTLEEGAPLSAAEVERMPDADTVWLIPLTEMRALLDAHGLTVTWQEDCTASHLATVDSLIASFEADEAVIRAQLGDRALDELLAGHRLWSDWLRTGRVRKFAVVAQQRTASSPPAAGGFADPPVLGERADQVLGEGSGRPG